MFQRRLGHHTPGGVAGRIEQYQAGLFTDQTVKSGQIKGEILCLDQGNRHGDASGDFDHGFVSRETGIGIDDFVTGLHQRQSGEKQGGFCARANNHLRRINIDIPARSGIFGDGRPQRLNPGGRGVTGETAGNGLHSGLGNIFVEHKVFGGLKATIGFETNVELDKFVIQLAEGIKHPVTFRDPCVDATLPDGSRINIVYGIDVSKRGSNFTIRKFSPTPMSILEMIDTGSLNYEMAAYLSICLQENMNLWVSGETASGKTTLMNALTTFVPPESKIVSIEDTPEVQVPHPNWIRGCTRESSSSSESSSVTMFDLLKAALRQRPNMIIVGEIRGEEGAIAFQGMQTGHACMSTFHAATVTKLIQRLTGNPINIPKSYVDNLNLVVIAQQVRLPNGKSGRRTTSINEIISYDSISDSFSFLEAFVWDPVTDTHYFKGHMNSYLLEYKIAPKRGLSEDKRRQIYTMLKQRAGILKRMHEQKITNFYDLHGVLSKAYRDGHFR